MVGHESIKKLPSVVPDKIQNVEKSTETEKRNSNIDSARRTSIFNEPKHTYFG
jgi:hypothetical protein